MAVYASDIVGDGTESNPFRPAVADVGDLAWSAVDGRSDATQPEGSMLVFCDPTPDQAATLAKDPRVELIDG